MSPLTIHFQEGDWLWTNSGSSFNFTNWESDQPSNDSASNCARIKNTGEWAERSCLDTSTYRPICQLQQKPNQLATALTKLDIALSDKISELADKVGGLCPPEWIQKIGIGCFYFGTTATMSWQDARDHCRDKNPWADLPEIHNAEVNAFIRDIMIEKSYDYCWIGGSDGEEVSKGFIMEDVIFLIFGG